MKKVIHLALAATFLALAAPSAGHAVTYNLSTDFSNSANPNSVWSYVYGNTPLPNQPAAIANGNSFQPATAGGYFSTGNNLNQDTPFVARAAVNGSAAGGTNLDFVAGDIVIHSPNDGTALSIRWTAPSDGLIDFHTLVWYAHSSVDRSNDVSLLLGGNPFDTVLVNTASYTNNTDRWDVTGNGFSVAAGEILELVFAKTAGQPFGSLNGLSFDVDFTPNVSAVPEPSTWAMMILGFAGVGFVAYRRKAKLALTTA
ncbi:MAG: PEP-CTERM sorting domain-containing protein [Rhizobiales bacterium]|nr:PEP-CTERM sorting domain-containing protein [Hyphomicrobiales bacterium]